MKEFTSLHLEGMMAVMELHTMEARFRHTKKKIIHNSKFQVIFLEISTYFEKSNSKFRVSSADLST